MPEKRLRRTREAYAPPRQFWVDVNRIPAAALERLLKGESSPILTFGALVEGVDYGWISPRA